MDIKHNNINNNNNPFKFIGIIFNNKCIDISILI